MSRVVALANLVSDDGINTISKAGFRPEPSGLLAVGCRQQVGIEDAGINVDLPSAPTPPPVSSWGLKEHHSMP